ncbi:predicted protein [Histoplasma capsulatum var. duboisii H88]|uniref:Predicted protein n=2 Tax=Ajellomyces capsulatus TaxID=5037 RepID=F0UN26_AJEC8|nr:predicted protein [Histoplasma capsulatum H143]EGC47493.1 predicted protein [Histoplasma capsulatum var. duboisii H88]
MKAGTSLVGVSCPQKPQAKHGSQVHLQYRIRTAQGPRSPSGVGARHGFAPGQTARGPAVPQLGPLSWGQQTPSSHRQPAAEAGQLGPLQVRTGVAPVDCTPYRSGPAGAERTMTGCWSLYGVPFCAYPGLRMIVSSVQGTYEIRYSRYVLSFMFVTY